MTMKYISIAVALLLTLVFPLASTAGVPSLINFQGQLVDTNGAPVSAIVTAVVHIYDGENSTNAVYSETLGTVVVQKGSYSFNFGADEAGLATALQNESCWLGVELDGRALAPRYRMVSVPYALYARNAGTVNEDDFVKKEGDTMTGPLTLAGDPMNSLDAATKRYVDQKIVTAATSPCQLVERYAVAGANRIEAGEVVYFSPLGVHRGGSAAEGPMASLGATNWGGRAVALDPRHVLATPPENDGNMWFGDVDGDTVTWGDPLKGNGSVVIIDSNHVAQSYEYVLQYPSPPGSRNQRYRHEQRVRLGTVVATGIAWGADAPIYAWDESYWGATRSKPLPRLVPVDSNYFYILETVLGSCGATIQSNYVRLPGYYERIPETDVTLQSVFVGDDTYHFFGVLYDAGVSNARCARVRVNRGPGISGGTPYTLEGAALGPKVGAWIDAHRFVVIYPGIADGKGKARMGFFDDYQVTCTWGPETEFCDGQMESPVVTRMDDSKVLVACRMTRADGAVCAVTCTGIVGEDAVRWGSPVAFGGADAVPLGLFSDELATTLAYSDGQHVQLSSVSRARPIGIALDGAGPGETCPAVIAGTAYVASTNMAPGKIYYDDATGSLTTDDGGCQIGMAVAGDKIQLNLRW